MSDVEASPPKPPFFRHADAHIDLSNRQLGESDRGTVSGSLMFASARFNAWLLASSASTLDEARAARETSLDYLARQYREMLADNLDDYLEAIEQDLRHAAGH